MNSGAPLGIGTYTKQTLFGLVLLIFSRSGHDSQTGKPGSARFQIEVILSAGSIGTLHILLHSGIGDSESLASLGISPVHDLPSVGRNLSDHPHVRISWLVNSTKTFNNAERNATVASEELEEWLTTKTVWVLNNLLSRGSVTLNSAYPFDTPVINPNLLGVELDLLIMRESMRSAQRFAAAPTFEDHILSPFSIDNTASDTELDSYIRNHATSLFHPVGTAAMSAPEADHSVVDPDLTVRGLGGLRIVDGSVLPYVPAAHTQAAVYVFAERAADLIKAVFKDCVY
ncbi:GMC oxidoreductase-domain-containing protein [Mycena olivaceomarginata]|nr:GMC oxidoreductase-domain-containing protein [Mycena olivaceomarginata]